LKKYKVISLDLFGTLVDVSSIKYTIWREFLSDRFTETLADTYWDRAMELVFKNYEALAMNTERHFPARRSFELAYSELFREINLEYNPQKAARMLAKHHAYSRPHTDVISFLEVLSSYKVCLSSDTDDDMLGSLTTLYHFDHVFTSEKLRCYKANINGRFFSVVVDYYKVNPEEILHIGDGRLEIVSARKAGLMTCWLNRNAAKWSHTVKPHFEIGSLLEAVPIVDGVS
jgi:FMN hydrolase / 5-amino-6-(5-phospho-D-ribitylamino)uracil phosphatase